MQLRPFRSLDPGDKAMGWRVRASLWAGAPPWPGASPASPPAGLSGGFERRKSVNLVSLPNHLRPQWPCRCPGDTGDWLLHAVTAGVVSRQRVASFLGWKVPEGGHAELWKLLSSPSCPRLQAPGGDLRLTGFGGPSPPRLSHGVRAVCTQWRRGLSPDPSVVMGPGDTGGLAGPLLIKSLPPSSSPGPPRAPPRTARSLFWKPGTSSSIPQLPVMVPGLGLECALWTGFQWVRGAGRGAGTVRSSGTATQLHQSTEHERPPWSSEAALLPRAVWPWGLGWVLSPGGSSS